MKKRADDTEQLLLDTHDHPSRNHSDDEDFGYDAESPRSPSSAVSVHFDQWPHVFNLANCIVGVSVLAMPFCFQKCGILLTAIMIGICSVITKFTCHFLAKGSFIARKRSYEAMAAQSSGALGRKVVELLMLAYLISSIVAFLVVIGDIGPHIVAEFLELEAPTQRLRVLVLILVVITIILPLSFIKDLSSFSIISSAAFVFYFIFVGRMMLEAIPTIYEGTWSMQVVWWRPEGFFTCLPIVSMALSCQTQLFCVMDSIKGVTMRKVDTVVSSSINICSAMYAAIGIFGYVSFYDKHLHGDVLVQLESSFLTQILKLAFMLSIAVSIPLMLFPARIALFNLLLRRGTSELPVSGLQNSTFHILTFVILMVNTIIAILVPNVEFILGLTGSLIGSLVTIIIPSAMFISIAGRKVPRTVPYAKICVVVGFAILVLSTWATLSAEQKTHVVAKPQAKADPKEVEAEKQVIDNLEKIEEKVLVANLNISQKLDDMARLAEAGRSGEAKKVIEEIKEQQQEQQKLIREQEEMVDELKKDKERSLEVKEEDKSVPAENKTEMKKEGEGENEKKVEKKEAKAQEDRVNTTTTTQKPTEKRAEPKPVPVDVLEKRSDQPVAKQQYNDANL